MRSSDEEKDRHSDDQDFSKRSLDRGDRDSSNHFHEYGGGGRRPGGGRRDGDSSFRGGGKGRRFGGYGQTHNYNQQRTNPGGGGGKFGGGGGGGRAAGGRGNTYSGYNNATNRNLQNSNADKGTTGSEDVVARLQKGLSLLPPPKEPQCGNLDQFNYPAPPSWYLQEVEEWEKRMQEGAGPSGGENAGKAPLQKAVESFLAASSQAPPSHGYQNTPPALTASQGYLGGQIPIPSSQIPISQPVPGVPGYPPTNQILIPSSQIPIPSGQIPIPSSQIPPSSVAVPGYPNSQVPIPLPPQGFPISSQAAVSVPTLCTLMPPPQGVPTSVPSLGQQITPLQVATSIPTPGQMMPPLSQAVAASIPTLGQMMPHPPQVATASVLSLGQTMPPPPQVAAASVPSLGQTMPPPPQVAAASVPSLGQTMLLPPPHLVTASVPSLGQTMPPPPSLLATASVPSLGQTMPPPPSLLATASVPSLGQTMPPPPSLLATASVPSLGQTMPPPPSLLATASVPSLGQTGALMPILQPVAASVPSFGQMVPGVATTLTTVGQSIPSVSTTPLLTTASLPGSHADGAVSAVPRNSSNPALPLLAVAVVPSSGTRGEAMSAVPPVGQSLSGFQPSMAPGAVTKTTLPTEAQDSLKVPLGVVSHTAEEGGGGAADMEVCPISPTPNPIATSTSEDSKPDDDMKIESGNGGVADEKGVVNEKPAIATVNPREQLIKLSEITRVQVYVAPVTSSELKMTSSDAPPPSQQATPTIKVTDTPPTTSCPPPSTEVMTAPPQSLSLNDVLSKEFEMTTKVTPTPTVETTPKENEILAYSLRSKAKESTSKTAPSAKKTLPPRAGVRPNLLSDSDSDVNYDDYLDQLVEEEEEEPGGGGVAVALTLSSALSGDFPLLGGAAKAQGGKVEAVPSLDEQLNMEFPLISGSVSKPTGGAFIASSSWD